MVAWEAPPYPIRVAGAAIPAFVGRAAETSAADEAWAAVRAGGRQIIFIGGEPGAGKSRLVYELQRRLWEQPVLFLAGRCISYGGGVPYLPILHMLRNEWGIGETDEAATVAAKHGLPRRQIYARALAIASAQR